MNRRLITVLRKLKNALKQAFAMLIKIRFPFSFLTNNQRPFLGRQMGL